MNTGPRSALVLASTSGLGFECARAIGQNGFDVVICGRSEDRVETALAQLTSEAIDASGHVADVSDAAALNRLFHKLAKDRGPVDTLIVNSGGPRPGSPLDLGDQDWAFAVDLVLMSAVRACRWALPPMLDAGFGRIVFIGSSSVRRPIPGLSLSNALRPALNGLVKDLAIEVAARGVTVNMVAPGRIDTDRTRELDAFKGRSLGLEPSSIRELSESSIPAGRYGRPGELASVVRFLVSEEAAYVNGQTVLVDGAMTASHP